MRTAENTRNPNPNPGNLRLHTLGPAVASSVLVLLFLLSGIAAFHSIQAVHSQDQEVGETRAVMVVIEIVYTDLNGVQSGAANYIISGNTKDLVPYTDSRVDLLAELSKLHSLTQGLPIQVGRVSTLQSLAPPELSSVDHAVRLRESGQQNTALDLIVAQKLMQMFARSRALVEQLGLTEKARLNGMVAEAASTVKTWTLVVILISLVDLVLLMIIISLVRQTMRLRERLAHERARVKVQTELQVLQETNRRMDEFISIASHEFRTPLTTLKANLQLVARRLRRLDETWQSKEGSFKPARDFLPLIDRATLSTDRLERLANDLLDVSRIKAGELVMRPVPLDLTVLVCDCVEEQRQNQPIRTIGVLVPQQVVTVLADPDRIHQTITNYLTNALKFSGEEKPVHVSLAFDDRQAKVSVRDEGPGLPRDEQERIWERFHRAPAIEHKSGSNVGLGLGLYICKTIIDQHGGQVGVDSTEGHGATFWFSLPLAANQNQAYSI